MTSPFTNGLVMNGLTLLCGVIFLAVQLQLYRRQHKLFPTPPSSDRSPYATTLPTRLFRTLKFPLGIAVLLHLALLPFSTSTSTWPRFVLGAAIGSAGLLLLDRSLIALGKNFAPCDRGLLPKEYVRRGPYRFLDHPIYVANLLIFGGMAVQSFSWWLGGSLAVLSVIYFFSARDEKKALRSLDTRPSF